MFIQTESTPNPATLKFIPGCRISPQRPFEFDDLEQAENLSPLAAELLTVDGVATVFFGADFIAVSKEEKSQWPVLKPEILSLIMEHVLAGRIWYETANTAQETETHWEIDPQDQSVVDQLRELLDERVRPAVARDGGDIIFKGYRRGVVYLTLRGACAGCPSASATLRMGIENLFRHFIPEIIEVRSVE